MGIVSQIGATGLICAGAGVNFAYAASRGQDYFPGLLAAGLLVVATGMVTAFSPPIGTGLAALFFLSSFLNHGVAFWDTVTKLLAGKAK